MRALVRMALLLALAACAAAALLGLRAARRPLPAPAEVQADGRHIASEGVRQLRVTDFGRSARGRLVLDQVDRFLAEDRIVFSSKLGGPRGLTWKEMLGRQIVYVRVMEMANGHFLHQTPGQLMEVLCHEAVHALKGHYRPASLEEECDAYAAGLCAQAAIEGHHPPAEWLIDGMPVAEFVVRNYPGIRRNPTYIPIGKSREDLFRRTGIQGLQGQRGSGDIH